jgi:hypothetical protein
VLSESTEERDLINADDDAHDEAGIVNVFLYCGEALGPAAPG